MINLTAETPISLKTACDLVPPAHGGERTHLQTLLNWILRGARGPSGGGCWRRWRGTFGRPLGKTFWRRCVSSTS
jgi:hypothetical protein